MADNPIKRALESVGKRMVIRFGQELTAQRHSATGKLIQSFQTNVSLSSLVFGKVEVTMIRYGLWVDSGRAPGVKGVPIQALMEWIRVKGIATADKVVRSIAFAIMNKIKKEGIPTSGSRRIASKRTGFLQDAINKESEGILNQMEEGAFRNFTIGIDQLVKESNDRLR